MSPPQVRIALGWFSTIYLRKIENSYMIERILLLWIESIVFSLFEGVHMMLNNSLLKKNNDKMK